MATCPECHVSRLPDHKDDNEMKPGAVHRSGIYLTADENTGKPQLGDRLMKAVRPVIISNGPLPQMSHHLKWVITSNGSSPQMGHHHK